MKSRSAALWYGSSNAAHDIPRLVEPLQRRTPSVDELITREYTLDQINEGWAADMRSGRNIRGLIRLLIKQPKRGSATTGAKRAESTTAECCASVAYR